MIDVLLGLLQIFDLHFVRLVFNLVIDYLITAGYLLPEQRAIWEQGYINIIGIISAAVFMAIWQYKAKHPTSTVKTTTQNKGRTVETVTSGVEAENVLEKYGGLTKETP
jgi:hypothetical protein